MRERLVYKLFLALLATATAVAVAMALLIGWSFNRGFRDYAEQVQLELLGTLAERLEKGYAASGSWDFLRRNGLGLGELMRPDDAPPPPRHPREGPPFFFGRPPLPGGQPLPPPPNGGPPPMEGGGDRFRIAPRAFLLNADRQPLLGPVPPEGSDARPLHVAGEIVGWIGLLPLRAEEEGELRFLRRQTHAFYGIAATVVVLAALGSLLLARRLLRPVKALAGGARALAKGRYSTRIPVKSKDELGQLAADFNRLAQALERNETSRRRWIADISHELRTPLAVLRGEIEALQDGIRTISPDALRSLHGEVLQLARLVDDLYQLALSDLGALSYHKRDLDPLGLLADLAAGFEHRFEQAGLHLVIASPPESGPMILADAERLGQLFHNLMENSLRYTDRGGRLELAWELDGGKLHIDFRDSAPGVPDDAYEQLFERLFRVEESRNRAHGGAGLGLAICRNIVDAHEGVIEARPSPLGGLWIRVTLPLSNPLARNQ